MSAIQEARAHLAKAREFLLAAQFNHDLELHSAATSDAVVSAINSKDAICLRLTGRTSKSDDHNKAVPELRQAGPAGAALATTFSRLLGLKTRSQYQPAAIAAGDAAKAVEWASRMLQGAEDVVTVG